MPPAFSWFLALRYLVTRWVNVIGMAGIALAVWAMIVVIAVFSGFISESRKGIREASPDLLLTALPKGSDFVALEAVLRTDPDLVALAPRISHYAMLYPHGGRQLPKHTKTLAGPSAQNNYVLLLGIDPVAEAKTTGFTKWITSSPKNARYRVDDLDQPFDVSPKTVQRAVQMLGGQQGEEFLGDQPGVLVSVDRLRGGPEILRGQRLDVMSVRFQEKGEDYELRKIKIGVYLSGAFQTGHRLLDMSVCMMDIELLREYLGDTDPFSKHALVTDVAIKVRDGADAKTVGQRLVELIKPLGGGRALTWEDQNATYLGAVEQERALMKLVLFAVMLVAGFLIFATLHMMVTQKIKDIGILTSLGATPGGVGAIFLLGGFVVGIVGCAIGTLTGCLSAWLLNPINRLFKSWFGEELFPTEIYNLQEVPVELEAAWVLQVVAGALVLALLVSWWPARKAARQDPVKALMHE